MPHGLVKSKGQEAIWRAAKSAAKKSNPDNLYALTTHIYKNKLKEKGRK